MLDATRLAFTHSVVLLLLLLVVWTNVRASSCTSLTKLMRYLSN